MDIPQTLLRAPHLHHTRPVVAHYSRNFSFVPHICKTNDDSVLVPCTEYVLHASCVRPLGPPGQDQPSTNAAQGEMHEAWSAERVLCRHQNADGHIIQSSGEIGTFFFRRLELLTCPVGIDERVHRLRHITAVVVRTS